MGNGFRGDAHDVRASFRILGCELIFAVFDADRHPPQGKERNEIGAFDGLEACPIKSFEGVRLPFAKGGLVARRRI